jgi:glycogen operon protein
MLLGGDEFRRSQGGNNNAYCQDNETSWVDWFLLRQNHDLFRFARGVLALRRAHAVLRREAFYTDADVQWFNPFGVFPDWSDRRLKCLGCLIRGVDGPDLFLMCNADLQPIRFVLPPPSSGSWCVAVDTFQESPDDVYAPGDEGSLEDRQDYVLESRSSAVLVAGQPPASWGLGGAV